MSGLFLKLFAIITFIGGLLLMGFRSGRKKEQVEQLKAEHNELLKNNKINKKIDSMSFSDKSNFLLSKQRNKVD